MKLLKVALTSITLFAVLGLSTTQAAEVQNSNQDTTYTVFEDVHDDLYVTGEERVSVEGNVYGDLFVASGLVRVSGEVEGDLYIAGGQVTIMNDVGGSVFAAGGQIDVDGTVNRSVYIAGGNVDINADIEDDVMIFAGQVTLAGTVGDDVRGAGGYFVIDSKVSGDVIASAGTLNLNGDVLGDVVIAGEDLSVATEMVGGNLTIYGDEEKISLNDNVEILGDYRLEEQGNFESDASFNARPFLGGFSFASLVSKLFFAAINSIGLILLGVLMLKVAPVKTEQTLRQMKDVNTSFKSLGIGILAFPVLGFLALLLLISVIGWPILWVLLALAAIAKNLAVPLFGLRLGRYLLNRIKVSDSGYIKLIVGILTLSILFLIPCLGTLAQLLVTATTAGAMLTMHYKNYMNAQSKTKKASK